MKYVTLYLVANAAANLLLAATPLAWRATATIAIAFSFVAFDLVARDRLHDRWRGDWRRLAPLVAGGALLSALVNAAAWPIALASCLAFAAAGAADTLVYARLRRRGWYWRTNGSNAVSAVVDSAVFLSVAAALGVFPLAAIPLAFAGQVGAKTLGGAAWAWALGRAR